MVIGAQRLPIAAIPEQPHVATMRNTMIHHVSSGTTLFAVDDHLTAWIAQQEFNACLSPSTVIAAISGRHSLTLELALALDLACARHTMGDAMTTRTNARSTNRHWITYLR